MSDSVNPYKSPQAESVPVQSAGSAGNLNDAMVRYLRETSPWARFLGIIGFIQCGLMALGGLVSLVVIPAFISELSDFSDMPSFFAGGVGGLFGFIYIIGAALLFFPARFAYNFGTKIRSYQRSGAEEDLEAAFKNNKSLWKFFGILAIVSLALIPFSLIFASIVVAAFVTA
ncbi:MAG: hypothetical protein LBD71_05165 [Treponema sp.]|nr:hypothetical protein [Treponema sp.]